MTISRRELMLGMTTLALVILGGSYILGRPLLEKWENAGKLQERLVNENKFAARLINQKAEVVEQLKTLRGSLPKYEPQRQVTAELLKMIKKLADENQLTLSRLQPDKETAVGDLSEVAIECQWDGTLESLAHFLYAVQIQGAILDIRQLNVSPMQGAAGRLKGTFTMFCAFTREAAAPAAGTAPAPATTP